MQTALASDKSFNQERCWIWINGIKIRIITTVYNYDRRPSAGIKARFLEETPVITGLEETTKNLPYTKKYPHTYTILLLCCFTYNLKHQNIRKKETENLF